MASRSTVSVIIAAGLLLTQTSAFAPFGVSTVKQNSWLMMARRGVDRNRRTPPILENRPPMNEGLSVKYTELRVVTPSPKGKDEPLGVMNVQEAMAMAKEMGGLDVILINPNSDPPVCKICDYSKHRYMQEKKTKEVKKNSKTVEVKEVKMSYKIDVHDYDVRMKLAEKFLKQGNRVKCTVTFRGREVQHDKLGFELVDKLAVDLVDICLKEGAAKREGRNLSLMLGPRPEVLKLLNEKRRNTDKEKKEKKVTENEQKVASKSAGAAVAAGAAGEAAAIDGGSNDFDLDDEDSLDLDSTLESSLDDLFGSDGLTDDLFS
jgi:translation initiation factor IF-3